MKPFSCPTCDSLTVARTGATLHFARDTVTKHQDPDVTRLELAKTKAGYEVGRRSGLFKVPRVLAHDVAAGTITFERLRGIRHLKEYLASQPPGAEDLMERVAHVLVAIHRQLTLPADLEMRASDPRLPAGGPLVCIHGDFCWNNISYDAVDDQLILFDWTASRWLGMTGTLASPYLELATFVRSLFNHRPLGKLRIVNPERLSRIFLQTYFSASCDALRCEPFQRYFGRVLSLKLEWDRRRHLGRFLAYRWSYRRAQRFVAGLRPGDLPERDHPLYEASCND